MVPESLAEQAAAAATTPTPRPASIDRIDAITLRGPRLDLVPLDLDAHADALFEITPPGCFEFFLSWPERWDRGSFRAWLAQSLTRPGIRPFVVVDRDSGQVLGCSSLYVVDAAHAGLEIGFTWYAPAARGTWVNPECKLLLLSHGFDHHRALRIQLKCDARNARSRAAIAKLGAAFEGVLRKHRVLPDGYARDTAYFSVIDTEWPAVKAGLLARLGEAVPGQTGTRTTDAKGFTRG